MRVTDVGQSLGGGVALQFAHWFRKRCEHLVLLDRAGMWREATFYLDMLIARGFEPAFPH